MKHLITFLFISLLGLLAQAEQKLEKDVSFEDILVKGKYHFADEAVVTVEEDKVLDSLLGIRKDFKDRLSHSLSHH